MRKPDLPRSRDKRIWHFMFEATSIDDIGAALDLASKAGVPVVSTLGRHLNDQMVSFYMSTPSGFEVEYVWGSRLIDDATWQVQRHDRGTLWGHTVLLDAAPQPAPASAARCQASSDLSTGPTGGWRRGRLPRSRLRSARRECAQPAGLRFTKS